VLFQTLKHFLRPQLRLDLKTRSPAGKLQLSALASCLDLTWQQLSAAWRPKSNNSTSLPWTQGNGEINIKIDLAIEVIQNYSERSFS